MSSPRRSSRRGTESPASKSTTEMVDTGAKGSKSSRKSKGSVQSVKSELLNVTPRARRNERKVDDRQEEFENKETKTPNKISEESAKRKRGRPPKAVMTDVDSSEKTPAKSTRDDDEVVTLSVRKSSRSRVVKSARELLGLIPADKIKKENETSSKPQEEAVARTVSLNVAKTVSDTLYGGAGQDVAENRINILNEPELSAENVKVKTYDVIEKENPEEEYNCKTDNSEDKEQHSESQIIETDVTLDADTCVEIYDGNHTVTLLTQADTPVTDSSPRISTVSYADAENNALNQVQETFLSIPEPSKTQFSIKKAGNNQNVQVVKTKELSPDSQQPFEVQIIGEEDVECLDGLVDPETGHVVLPTQTEIQEEMAQGTASTSMSTPLTVQEMLGGEKRMTQYVIYNSKEREISFDDGGDDGKEEEPQAKRARIEEEGEQASATEVLINLQHSDLELVERHEEEEIDSISQMQEDINQTTAHGENDKYDKLHESVHISEVIGECTDLATPNRKQKQNFNNVPMTSVDLAAAPRNKSGRCKPQKHIVVAPELQEMVDKLKENDVMENHIVRVGEKEGYRNKYACKYCGVDIYNRHQFRKHINSKHKDIDFKPWKCPLCDYTAIIKAAIARHINIHSDLKPYTCSECGKGFTFRQKLQIHMKYHEDVRDHKCALCNMAFHELKTLKTHLLKIHGIDKPKQFIDKYRGQRLTSVLVQLDSTSEPTQGYILPKEGAQTIKISKPVAQKIPVRPSGLRVNEESKLFSAKRKDGPMNTPQERRIVQHPQPTMEEETVKSVQAIPQTSGTSTKDIYIIGGNSIENDVSQASMSTGTTVEPIVEQSTDNLVEGSIDGVGTIEVNLEDTSITVDMDTELVVIPESEVSVVTEEGSMDLDMQVENVADDEVPGPDSGVQPAIMQQAEIPHVKTDDTKAHAAVQEIRYHNNAESDSEEVSVLLPTHKKSTSYGTRKTLLRTSRYKLGLEASNYTPISQANVRKVAAKEEVVAENEDVSHEVDMEDDIDEASSDSPLSPHKSARKKVNNQKIVTDEQLEDELKKYCKIDTTNEESRIIFTCTVCPPGGTENDFYSKTQFCHHLEVEHPEVKPWLCTTCGFKCRMRTSLLAHIKTHDFKKNYECEICGKKFLFKQKLNVHMRSHANLRNHECNICHKRFNERADITRHIKRVHENSMNKYQCHICERQFRDQSSLETHEETHDPYKKYLCPYCKRLYRSRGSLAQHMKSHTCMFHCEICNKNFGSYSGFMAHKVMHDQSYEGFECDICKKVLHTKGSYTRHKMVSHTDIRPYQCVVPQCNKSFKTKKDLKNHAFVHTSVRAFSCAVCNFSCKRMESLKIHMRRHSEVKPFQCGLCGKQYTQKHSLESHLRHHTAAATGPVQLSCSFCDARYSSKYLLNKHMVSAHPGMQAITATEGGTFSIDQVAGEGGGVTVFMCEECNSVFLSQDDLAVHILAQHMKQGFNPVQPKMEVETGISLKTELDAGATDTGLSIMEQNIIPDTTITPDLLGSTTLTSSTSEQDMVEYVTIAEPGVSGGERIVTLLHPPTPTSTQPLIQQQLTQQDLDQQHLEVEVAGEVGGTLLVGEDGTLTTVSMKPDLTTQQQLDVLLADTDQLSHTDSQVTVAETVEVQH